MGFRGRIGPGRGSLWKLLRSIFHTLPRKLAEALICVSLSLANFTGGKQNEESPPYLSQVNVVFSAPEKEALARQFVWVKQTSATPVRPNKPNSKPERN